MVHIYCSTKQRRPVKVNEKIIGTLEGNRFTKTVTGSKHMLRCPPAWCLSADMFEQEVKPYVTEIIIRDTESGLTYRVSTETFAEHCFEIQRGSFERQLGLPLNHWQVQGNGHRQLSLWGDEQWQ